MNRLVNRLALLLTTTVLAACGSGSGTPGTCDLNFASEVNANFGDVKLDSLIESASRFGVASVRLSDSIRASCNAIAEDLGETGDASDTEVACQAASDAIDATLAANSDVTLVVEFIPGVCSADVDAYAECVGECDASFDASATPPRCEGGELSGSCSGQCSGECSVEGDVTCTGSCSGSCSGTCDAEISGTCSGTCTGQCEGTCSATAADGSCIGTCTGTCRGTCDATVEGTCSGTCSGMCEGSCRSTIEGSCSGTCSGGCDVAFMEPTCEGGTLEVDADADCSASCEADASFDLSCTDPSIAVTFTGAPTAAADIAALLATLEANLGNVLAVGRESALVADATVTFASQLGGATAAAARAGLEAADCLAQAIEAQVAATARISVTVMASVSVSGSASASTN